MIEFKIVFKFILFKKQSFQNVTNFFRVGLFNAVHWT